MSVIQGYLWVCAAFAVGISLVLGLTVILAGAGRKGGANFSPWPLVAAISGTLLCLQIGYLVAPLALRAEGEWWRWAFISMLPPALLSLFALAGNLARTVRQGIVQKRPATVRPALTIAMLLQAVMYVGAPVVLWLARSPQGG